MEEPQCRSKRHYPKKGEMDLAQNVAVEDSPINGKEEGAGAHSVRVENVDHDVTVAELKHHFQGCGPVRRVTISVDDCNGVPRRFADIEFSDKNSVEAAMMLHGSEFRGRRIKVISFGSETFAGEQPPPPKKKCRSQDSRQGAEEDISFELSSDSSLSDGENTVNVFDEDNNVPSGAALPSVPYQNTSSRPDSQELPNREHKWEDLPFVVLEQIFSHLQQRDKLSAAQACKKWLEASSFPVLWRKQKFLFKHGKNSRYYSLIQQVIEKDATFVQTFQQFCNLRKVSLEYGYLSSEVMNILSTTLSGKLREMDLSLILYHPQDTNYPRPLLTENDWRSLVNSCPDLAVDFQICMMMPDHNPTKYMCKGIPLRRFTYITYKYWSRDHTDVVLKHLQRHFHSSLECLRLYLRTHCITDIGIYVADLGSVCTKLKKIRIRTRFLIRWVEYLLKAILSNKFPSVESIKLKHKYHWTTGERILYLALRRKYCRLLKNHPVQLVM